ncbi:PREDICTED: dynein regulatory complex protein 1 [Lepidothrix coronata]|uniref:Dynein regulatory complex protein 1 n=1 Tax=Lepidothrix coronata TaxID=321398 RepID=A0A6J0J8H2_9PASS|nr:PREDICTED: dynein regulatory complex protein 1 [Lepidothrix coronata]
MENREGGAAPAALHEIREPSPGPEPDLHLGAAAAAAAESGPEPGAAAEAASERAERIGARRSRVESGFFRFFPPQFFGNPLPVAGGEFPIFPRPFFFWNVPPLELQYLERKLQETSGIFHLNKAKLEYNLEVLRQQDLENSALRSLQKRRITRLQGALSNLNSRLEKKERKFREEKQSLECDRERLEGRQEETRSRMRHFSATGLDQFRRLWLLNEAEAKELIRKALEADRLLHVQQLGIPWEEPLHRFLENVGPLGEKPEKRTALRAAREALEGGNSGNVPGVFPTFPSPGLSRPCRSRFPSSQALRIEDEDDLFQLVDSFLKHKSREAPEKSQSQGSAGGDLPDPAEEGGAASRQEELRCSRNSRSSVRVHVDDVPKILKEFLSNFDRLRDAEAAAAREALDIRDSSGDAEYWEALAHVIPEPKLKLWDALDAALLEYHRVLSRRSELLSQATLLQQQNSELGMLLEEYLRSKASG